MNFGHVQMARQFAHAVDKGEPLCGELLAVLSKRTGIPPRQCLANIRTIAALPHPLDASVSAMWAQAFEQV